MSAQKFRQTGLTAVHPRPLTHLRQGQQVPDASWKALGGLTSPPSPHTCTTFRVRKLARDARLVSDQVKTRADSRLCPFQGTALLFLGSNRMTWMGVLSWFCWQIWPQHQQGFDGERMMTAQAWKCPFPFCQAFLSWHVLGLCYGDGGLEINPEKGAEREALQATWAQLRLLLCYSLLQQNLDWKSRKYFKYHIVHHICDAVGKEDVSQ